jgi:superfamily I DNA/RNA helicase
LLQDYDTRGRTPDDHSGMQAMQEVVTKLAFLDDTPSLDGPVTEAVQMMTLHKAKGLEFSVVILLGMDNVGIFGRADPPESLEDLEQRTNLVYVGVTRTENLLVVSMVKPGEGGGGRQLGRFASRAPSEPSVMLMSMLQEFGGAATKV